MSDKRTEAEVIADLVIVLETMTTPPRLRFGLLHSEGWVITSSKSVAQLLCIVWNHRARLAQLLRAGLKAEAGV